MRFGFALPTPVGRAPIRHDGTVVELLERPLYDEATAARLLKLSPSTLHWWLEGREQYRPVLRPEPTGVRALTWGEFVEARYVAAYRRDFGVKLQHIRDFIERLRNETGVRHPLATQRPWVGAGRRLLRAAQTGAELAPDLSPVWEARSGQLLLTSPAQSFLDVVNFGPANGDGSAVVRRILPAGPQSPVVIDPDLRAGLSSVRGISTRAIREMVDAGDAVEAVAEDFDLDLSTTVAALAFEDTLALAA